MKRAGSSSSNRATWAFSLFSSSSCSGVPSSRSSSTGLAHHQSTPSFDPPLSRACAREISMASYLQQVVLLPAVQALDWPGSPAVRALDWPAISRLPPRFEPHGPAIDRLLLSIPPLSRALHFLLLKPKTCVLFALHFLLLKPKTCVLLSDTLTT